MGFLSLLELGNLIKKLDLSNWFKHTESRNNIYVTLTAKPNELPKVIRGDEISNQEVSATKQEVEEFEFTDEERYLIERINKVRVLCDYQGFDFKKHYKQALNHIRKKSTDDWYECAAKDMVLIKEDINFFSAFKTIGDPEENELFETIKKDINYLYDLIQKIKHGDKRGDAEDGFLNQYDTRFSNNVLTEDRYVEVFTNFQNKLTLLFKKFNLIDE